MTLYTKSAICTAAVISAFMIICAFNYGRLTASRIELRSGCDLSVADREDLKVGWYQTGSR